MSVKTIVKAQKKGKAQPTNADIKKAGTKGK